MVIFKHNFRRFLTLKFLIIYFIIFIPIFLLFAGIYTQFTYGESSINSITDSFIASFFIVNFMWTLGIPFLITTASRGSALIQQEIDEETLVLLVSKPIDRKRIYLEKWLASFAISVLLGVLSLFLSLSLYIILYKIDSSILGIFMGLIPGLIVYVLFLNFIFTSISMTITMLLNHRTRSIIILIVFIMLYLLIFPFFKAFLAYSNTYEKYHIYLFDMNYQIGIMYYYIISIFSTVKFTPVAQQNIASFVGIFKISFDGYVDNDLGFIPTNFETLSYINPILLFSIWLGISGLCMFLSYYFLKKKDIS